MARRRRWSELGTGQQVAIVVASVAELALTATALRDLSRRPAAQVRGSKVAWALGCFVQPVGPLAYLKFGRR